MVGCGVGPLYGLAISAAGVVAALLLWLLSAFLQIQLRKICVKRTALRVRRESERERERERESEP